MQHFASGAVAAIGLVGSDDPPLSPETVGRGPSMFETSAVPLRSFETMLAERAETETTVTSIETLEQIPVVAEVRRLVVRLIGGEELELGTYDDRDGAVAAAQELITRFTSAENESEWPEIGGRYLRPASVTSIDVLVAE